MNNQAKMPASSARTQLELIFTDWANNYLTVATFAEHNGISEDQAFTLIKLARDVFLSAHPES